jgi:hypothetical protein
MRPILYLLSVLLLFGCGSDRPRTEPQDVRTSVFVQPRAPELRRVGQIELEETDSIYLAKPSGLSIDARDGSLYVSDGFWGRVLHFSADGRLLQVYGQRGEGPGELTDPGAVAVYDDELLVADGGLSRVARYRLQNGEALPHVTYRGVATSFAGSEVVWLGVQNLTDSTVVSRFDRGSGELRYLGRLPEEFLRSPPLAGIYTGVQVVTWADTIVAGFMGLNRLQVMQSDGRVLRDVHVPARHRRGELPNVVAAMEKLDFPELFAANSALFRMHRLPSGNFALIYYDQTIDGSAIQARVYLTLLSADFSRACVDQEIPVKQDTQPYTAFANRDLFVVQQEVVEERARGFVERFRIDEETCFRD